MMAVKRTTVKVKRRKATMKMRQETRAAAAVMMTEKVYMTVAIARVVPAAQILKGAAVLVNQTVT